MSREDDVQLARQLDALGEQDCYQVDEVLKESSYEVTQRVSLVGADGVARWPYVRKFIKRDSGVGDAYVRLFEAQREGHRFKYIPTIRECCERSGDLVVVMEFVSGETLEEHVARLGPSTSLARDAFPQLCDAVLELHEDFDPPLIHRDLTPSNVILSKGGLAVIDFGIAREFREGARADTVRLGTCSFAPPEQFGFGQTTVRSDVFALGMMLYYCLVGSVPDTYVAERDLADEHVPQAMRAVIAKATSLDPADRYADVRELKRAFSEAMGCAAEPSAEPSLDIESPKGGDGGRFAILGRIWNLVVIAALVVFLCACVASFVDPLPEMSRYPAWANALCYFVFLPLFMVSAAWLLLDKRRFKERFAVLRRYKLRHWALLCLSAFIVMFFGIGITLSASGVVA